MSGSLCQPYSSHSACYVWCGVLLRFLKINACPLSDLEAYLHLHLHLHLNASVKSLDITPTTSLHFGHLVTGKQLVRPQELELVQV